MSTGIRGVPGIPGFRECLSPPSLLGPCGSLHKAQPSRRVGPVGQHFGNTPWGKAVWPTAHPTRVSALCSARPSPGPARRPAASQQQSQCHRLKLALPLLPGLRQILLLRLTPPCSADSCIDCIEGHSLVFLRFCSFRNFVWCLRWYVSLLLVFCVNTPSHTVLCRWLGIGNDGETRKSLWPAGKSQLGTPCEIVGTYRGTVPQKQPLPAVCSRCVGATKGLQSATFQLFRWQRGVGHKKGKKWLSTLSYKSSVHCSACLRTAGCLSLSHCWVGCVCFLFSFL